MKEFFIAHTSGLNLIKGKKITLKPQFLTKKRGKADVSV
jgi:hypothetical protein